MENPEPREKPEKNPVSVIGADIVITGNIESSLDQRAVDLHIEGRVNGDVRCATLILGEGSMIKGSIHADRVRVSGAVEGSVETRDLAIEAGARVTGDIVYERLRVANGGMIEGNIKCRTIEGNEGGGSKLKLVEAPGDAKSKPIYID
ncbi:bactofilin family protein [Sphingosinicella rhizophila]|uniref:Polymer-forming cytoskeletal protein n=1 Tax=Sphingosinicella rhizophila TaxID=3050082 RepID=A0ABU3Q442_9SPHN|nr:polymer-forming cytoskeletal protein [Sphingosinicella sp. GR2756]MDT9598179.1 polymer-forming cytoskeletal protein [Sphingosinicella sp. GR2756]